MRFDRRIAPTPNVINAARIAGDAASLRQCCNKATRAEKRYSLASLSSGCAEARKTARARVVGIGNTCLATGGGQGASTDKKTTTEL